MQFFKMPQVLGTSPMWLGLFQGESLYGRRGSSGVPLKWGSWQAGIDRWQNKTQNLLNGGYLVSWKSLPAYWRNSLLLAVHLNSANSAQGFALEQVTCLLRTVHVFIPSFYKSKDVKVMCRVHFWELSMWRGILFCSLGWKFTAFRQLEGVLALYRKWTSTSSLT